MKGNTSWEPIESDTERIARKVIDAGYQVHRALGPGLLERVYEKCLCDELERRGIPFLHQPSLPIVYQGRTIESSFRLDLLVSGRIIVEIKASSPPNPLFLAQMLTYLRLARLRLGLLINFNVPLYKQGVKRVVL